MEEAIYANVSLTELRDLDRNGTNAKRKQETGSVAHTHTYRSLSDALKKFPKEPLD